MGWTLGGAAFGFGLLLLALGSLLRAPARRRGRDRALRRGCTCPVAVRGGPGATRDGFLFHGAACPVHGAAVRRAVARGGREGEVLFAALACLAGLAWMLLVLPR